jgi:hypothetical protein
MTRVCPCAIPSHLVDWMPGPRGADLVEEEPWHLMPAKAARPVIRRLVAGVALYLHQDGVAGYRARGPM